ncbi:MAG: hypothetical protein ACE14M_01450 [Terriglobales bacterium]
MQDLITLHEYFLALLEKTLGYAVLVPQQLQNEQDQSNLAECLGRWLGLLERAITPRMFRENLPEAPKTVQEALLRYFVRKQSGLRIDCYKTDIIATHLYKQWSRDRNLPSVARADAFTTPEFARVPEFAGPLYALLADVKLPDLPEEHRLLLREFPFVRQEVVEFLRFDKLLDSGLIQRVRDIKQSFGRSMYHPYVLAAFAEYNVVVGQKFDQLFREVLGEIKAFAANAEFRGGSVMGRVTGNITLKQMTEVVEEDLLVDEYEHAQAGFQRVSMLTKAVDRSLGKQAAPAGAAPASPPLQRPSPESQQRELEERLRRMKEASITRNLANTISRFVRSAEAGPTLVVPLRKGSVTLSSAERDAFFADYAGENSFRATYASMMIDIVSVTARLSEELELLKEKRESAYLWMPHADSLASLLQSIPDTVESGTRVLDIAAQRGLVEKVSAMRASLDKLRAMGRQARETLQALETGADFTKSNGAATSPPFLPF